MTGTKKKIKFREKWYSPPFWSIQKAGFYFILISCARFKFFLFLLFVYKWRRSEDYI